MHYSKLFSNNLTPNDYYVLQCIYNNCEINSLINKNLVYTKLKSLGFLNEDNFLSFKAIEFIKNNKDETLVITKTTKPTDFLENIEVYNKLFPRIKLPSGKYARTNSKSLVKSFEWFFKNYDYSWEIILKAAEKYVYDYELTNYKYMRTSQYFIQKQNSDKSYSSELADYCEMVLNGEDNNNHVFTEKVV